MSSPVWVDYIIATIFQWFAWIRTFGRGQPIVMRVLGYRPKVTTGEELARTEEWFVEEGQRQQAKKTAS